eukprot:m.55382 g.55382  ORF g.55382 m.55382 type:complete len:360 (+) comp22063_c0_seq1:268-1347(+)
MAVVSFGRNPTCVCQLTTCSDLGHNLIFGRMISHISMLLILTALTTIYHSAADSPPTQPIIFVKTPKCGGSTLARCFVNHATSSGLEILHLTGPFFLTELLVSEAKARQTNGRGFGLLYNHGGRQPWMPSMMTQPPLYFGVVRDPIDRARSLLTHGADDERAKSMIKGTFCSNFSRSDAVNMCDELKNNFETHYLASHCGCNRFAGTCVSDLSQCLSKSYAMLIPTEYINEARAILVLDHGFSIADALCTSVDQHVGVHSNTNPILAPRSTTPLKEFFEKREIETLIKFNPLDFQLHRYAVESLRKRIQHHGLKFNQTYERICTLLNRAVSECPIGQLIDGEERYEKFLRQFECLKSIS